MAAPTVQAIDKRSVHQICSGQVVVTLATAVKELVENSLDAGATMVEVRLKNWGSECLEVVDNGSGVLPENFAALALKHHTSKLNVFSDLVGVETFGFRGEALSSLCALGNLSITTCHKSQNIAARIEYDHDGRITKQHATARTQGTTITLQNLFSTLPVRHKEFLRNIKREYAKLVQVLQGYCVTSTGVRISCYNLGEKGKKTLVLATNGNNDVRENISNVFGPKQLQSLLEFKQINPTAEDCEDLGLDASQLASNPVFSLTGFVSRCEHGVGRGANDRQYIFINKRPCDMPKLTRLVNEVFHVFNRNQYPFAVLNIDLRKDLVDVNVTPDKRQVFLQQEKLLLATVKSSLKAMYDPSTSTYEINQKPLTQIKLPFNKRSNDEEGSQSGFSKSIKDKLLRAAKVSKASSILNFTTKTREVSKSVEDEPDRTSDIKTIRNALSPGSTEKSLDSGTLASTETGLGLVNVSEAKHDQACVLLTDASEKACEKACEKDLKMESATSHHTVKDGCSDFNANLENVEEYAMDNLERSQNVWNRSVDTTEHFSYSQEGNRLNLPEINVLRKPREQSLGEDAESPEMCKVEGLKNAVDGVNESNIVELTKMQEKTSREAVKDENYTVFEEQTDRSITNHDTYPARESKRNRNDEASDSPRVSKKIRLDESCTKAAESRKSIKVNFDVQKLREKFTGRKATATVAEDTSGYARTFRATIAPENNQRAEEELERHITKEMFKKMEIIGQFNQGFIITKLGDDLFIVDQHASDEKYNFEEQQKNTVIKSQRLIHPQSLDLTAINESILMDNLEVFRKNGFDFDIDEEAPVSQRVKLVSLPVSKNWSFGKSDVHELIFMLSDSPSVNYRPSNVRKMFASRACRMSVMVGTALNEGQMRRVVAHMGDMEHPWNCPHGRPTMRHLINLNMVRK